MFSLGLTLCYSAFKSHNITRCTFIPFITTRVLSLVTSMLRAFKAVELKSYNAILAPLIYQKHLAAVVVKQKLFADLLQCTSIDRCAL